MNLTNEQLAYIAGFLEGDGSFQIMRHKVKNKTYAYEYRISGYNTKFEIIQWLVDNVGGHSSEVKTSPRQKKPYHWHIKTIQALKLAEAITPFLVSKKEEVDIFIQFSRFVSANTTKKLTQEGIDIRVNLINQIRHVRNNKNIITRDECNKVKQIKPIEYPSQTDIAYLAGLIDAEGCFRLHRIIKKKMIHPAWASVMEIGNTNSLFFPWLMTKFGGNLNFAKNNGFNVKPFAKWYIMSNQMRKFTSDLMKYLIIKKPVCAKIIEFDQTVLPNGGDRHSDLFKRTYQEVSAKREIIFNQIQILNTRGQH